MGSDLFCFFIPGEENQIFPGFRLWETPLSGKNTRSSSDIFPKNTTRDLDFTIGDYFLACHRFLSKNDLFVLKTGLGIILKKSVQTDQIERISVSLEKHGAFYHPLKIQVSLHENTSCFFVLNGAVSRPGLALIKREYELISGLNKTCLKRSLPQVFGVDVIKTDKGRIGFFLGEWFEGYKEFHVVQSRNGRKVAIWESDGSCQYISETKALPIYREISRILTNYYDIETFDQILAWHHAAGDFIVKKKDDKVEVRLITVRGYTTLMDVDGQGEDKKNHMLPSLLFFFLNLTIRMRFDRLDGTGDMVILGDKILAAIVEGFLCGLDKKSLRYDYGNLRSVFITFIREFNLDQVTGLIENMLESSPLDPVESAVIKENIESHCKTLHLIFRNI